MRKIKNNKVALITLALINGALILGGNANAVSDDHAANLKPFDSISAGDIVALDGVKQFSIEAKIKLNTLKSYTKVISKQESRTNRIQLQINNGRVVAIIGNNANSYRTSTDAVIQANKWQHVAMVYNGDLGSEDRVKVYVDGTKIALSANATVIPTITTSTEADLVVGSNKFDGSIDELRVWDKALSQEDIALWRQGKINETHAQQHKEVTSGSATEFVDSLKLYWPFDDFSDATTVAAGPNTSVTGQASTALSYSENSNYVIFGYLPSYRVNSVDKDLYQHISHVIFKSIKPNADGTLHGHLNGNDAKAEVATYIKTIKEDVGDKQVKIIAGIGGGHASTNGEHIPDIAADENLRSALAKNIKNYCLDNGIDGIDLNWEFPVGSTEYDNWIALLAAIHAELNPQGLLFTASFRGRNGSLSHISEEQTLKLAKRSQQYLDLIIIQLQNRYDASGNLAPLNTFVGLIDDYADYPSIDKSKLLASTPFLGVNIANQKYKLRYNDIAEKVRNGEFFEDLDGPADDVAYNTVSGTRSPVGNYSINGVNTTVKKATYSKDIAIGGMSVWEMGNDSAESRDDSLLKAMHQVFPLVAGKSMPTPGFIANSVTVDTDGTILVAVGESVSFSDKSSHNPTSWQWSFEGGSPAMSTKQTETVTYTVPGTYAVTLTATNANGQKTLMRQGYIRVK